MLIVVTVAVVLGCLCAGGAIFAGYKILKSASTEPRAAVHAFVADLAAGDTNSAYEKLCTKTQAGFSRTDFATVVAAAPRPTKAKINGFSISNNQSARIDTTLTLVDGRTQAHSFELANEDGDWRICGNPY